MATSRGIFDEQYVTATKTAFVTSADFNFDLTIEQLLPIRSYVLDPDTGLPKHDAEGNPKVTDFFRKKDA